MTRVLGALRGRLLGANAAAQVSVVITVAPNTVRYLPEALASVRDVAGISEVLLAPYEGAEVRGAGASILPPATDLMQARSAAIAAARADYVMLLPAHDVLLPAGLNRLLEALGRSGSDLALGRAVVRRGPAAQPRIGVLSGTITSATQTPQLLTARLCDVVVVRRTVAQAATPTSAPAASLPRILDLWTPRMLLAARTIHVVDTPVVEYYDRAEGISIGTQPDIAPHLKHWLETAAALVTETSPQLRADLIRALLQVWLPAVLNDVERASDSDWNTLVTTVNAWVSELRPELGGWQWVRAEPRAKAWLVSQGNRQHAEEFVASRWYGREALTSVRQAQVLLDLEVPSGASLPDHARTLAVQETRAFGEVRGVQRRDDGALVITVWVWRQRVAPDEVEVNFNVVAGDQRFPVGVAARRQALGIDIHAREVRLSHADGEYDVVLTAEEVATWGTVDGQLVATVALKGTSNASTTTFRPPAGAGLIFPSRRLGDRLISFDTLGALRVCVEPAPLLVVGWGVAGRSMRVDFSGRVDEVSLLGTDAARVAKEGAASVRIDIPDVQSRRLALTARVGKQWVPVRLDPDAVGAPAPLTIAPHRSGVASVLEVGSGLSVSSLELGTDTMVLAGTWFGAGAVEVRLVGPVTVPGILTRNASDVTVRFRQQDGVLGWPSGEYRLEFDQPSTRALWAAESVLERTNQWHHVALRPEPNGELWLVLSAPLTEAERSGYGQEQLNQRYRGAQAVGGTETAAFFQSYAGATCTDSPKELDRYLASERPEVTRYWSVADRSVPVPEGAVALVRESEEWHRAFAAARWIVQNVDLERSHVPLPGQQFLQTFHGYPSKTMGIGFWSAKNFTANRIESELQRTMQQWDLILTPTPEMDQYYRREYDYTGPIFNQGLPRDDSLTGERGAQLRAQARAKFGIEEHQTAVLYAPTWREDEATGYESVAATAYLDVQRLAADLGEDHVLLLRGHRFERSAGIKTSARVLDVSAHPEVNEVIAAGDIGIFDYSSMRFDWALTGRPMLFLVPDLAVYTGPGRGFLFDFSESAPGPLLSNQDEVLEWLRDPERLKTSYAADLEAFNARFNPYQDGHAAQRLGKTFFQ